VKARSPPRPNQKGAEEPVNILSVYNYYDIVPLKQTATYRSPRAFSTLFNGAPPSARRDERPNRTDERSPNSATVAANRSSWIFFHLAGLRRMIRLC